MAKKLVLASSLITEDMINPAKIVWFLPIKADRLFANIPPAREPRKVDTPKIRLYVAV
jgi:hypothetical protein